MAGFSRGLSSIARRAKEEDAEARILGGKGAGGGTEGNKGNEAGTVRRSDRSGLGAICSLRPSFPSLASVENSLLRSRSATVGAFRGQDFLRSMVRELPFRPAWVGKVRGESGAVARALHDATTTLFSFLHYQGFRLFTPSRWPLIIRVHP
jgi:hypothetical protein